MLLKFLSHRPIHRGFVLRQPFSFRAYSSGALTQTDSPGNRKRWLTPFSNRHKDRVHPPEKTCPVWINTLAYRVLPDEFARKTACSGRNTDCDLRHCGLCAIICEKFLSYFDDHNLISSSLSQSEHLCQTYKNSLNAFWRYHTHNKTEGQTVIG